MVTEAQLIRLNVYFQQRHLLSHCQGIVDEEYLAKSGDASYAVGQRLVITEEAVLEFASVVELLGNGLIECLGRIGVGLPPRGNLE